MSPKDPRRAKEEEEEELQPVTSPNQKGKSKSGAIKGRGGKDAGRNKGAMKKQKQTIKKRR